MIFEGLREIADAYGSDPTPSDQHVADAVRFLASISGGPSTLGFFGRDKRPSDAVSVAVDLLREHGRQLTYEQTIKTVEILQTLDERRSVRRRFVMQILVTIAALAIALSVVFGLITASDDLKKIGYGLIGTVIGYWLK
ncbi:hypothetical protein [Bradyrhizobium oligotrophicum]|uniref:hypothetical protein n=1 Tax=Bradyrhizobium oligotrophicum TaxID=44255 RepID=UPI003EBFBCA3